MSKSIAILIAYHILFYWKAYFNPFQLARSELLSTFFPSWIYLGKGDVKHDSYYWGNYHAHPVLSSYYLPHAITARLVYKFSQNSQFRVFVLISVMHSLAASLGWYYLVESLSDSYVAIFGAITITYSAYSIKQQPCINYTIGWFPWLLLGIATSNHILASLSFGMIILAGYYPLGILITLVATLATFAWQQGVYSLAWLPMGLCIGMVQLVPFLSHLPKTIRKATGSIDPGYWEKRWYTGITPWVLACFSTSRIWPLAIITFLFGHGLCKQFFPRVHQRWFFVTQLCIGWMACSGLANLHLDNLTTMLLIGLQAFDLYIHNSKHLITHPFSELPKRPSWAFHTPLTKYLKEHIGDSRVSGLPYPLFTGHINQFKTLGYNGSMQTKAMAAWRRDTNPNGSGAHDWFKENEDDRALDEHNVKWAFTRKAIDWEPTRIRHLYKNPRMS